MKPNVIEENKAIKQLEDAGYSFLGCAGFDFNHDHVLDNNTGKLHTFKNAVEARNTLCKSAECSEVLQLMDTEECAENYCKALKIVLAKYPNVNRAELEKELNAFI